MFVMQALSDASATRRHVLSFLPEAAKGGNDCSHDEPRGALLAFLMTLHRAIDILRVTSQS